MANDKEHSSIILNRIFENGVCGDQITLICGKDGQRIPIHRCVLTAASKYFLDSFGSNFQEGSETELTLDYTDSETVKAIVDFCYTGRINLTVENVSKFHEIAFSIELDLLAKKCRQLYEDNLSVDNFIGTWILADKYIYGDLRQTAFDLICESFEKVPASDIESLGHRFLEELLKCDKIHANEELVFQRMFGWFQNSEGERNQYMAELLKLIRLEFIPSEILCDNTFKAAYRRFDCPDVLLVEHERRAVNQASNIGVRRGQTILCLFAQYKGEHGAECSAIKVEKFNRTLNCFEEAAEIMLGDRLYFGVLLQKNQIYVLAGSVCGVGAKSVSAFDLNSGKEEVLPEMNFVRRRFASILLGKYIYVFGGFSGSEAMNSCEWWANGFKYHIELYDPKSDEWIQLAPMNKSRTVFALAKWNGFLIAIGNAKVVEKYDPWKNRWTEIGTSKESYDITSALEINSEVVAIMRNGEFGQINFNGNGGCSFVRLSKLKYECDYLRRHYLCQN